ncbi:uncharacterized protein TRAVEDRAFT_60758, partial [Trametes versicolor FP-101664 SS1]|uniref:uncharacterized protein n=1 Tax=Trametes versicolor (strain FP-101664) TaxID=717944 RepID=UPI0004624917
MTSSERRSLARSCVLCARISRFAAPFLYQTATLSPLLLPCYAPNGAIRRRIFCDRLERVQSVHARHHLDISSRSLDSFAAHDWTWPRSKISVEGLCDCKCPEIGRRRLSSSTSVRANARCPSLVARYRWARGALAGDLRFVRCVVGRWLGGRRLCAAQSSLYLQLAAGLHTQFLEPLALFASVVSGGPVVELMLVVTCIP